MFMALFRNMAYLLSHRLFIAFFQWLMHDYKLCYALAVAFMCSNALYLTYSPFLLGTRAWTSGSLHARPWHSRVPQKAVGSSILTGREDPENIQSAKTTSNDGRFEEIRQLCSRQLGYQ